ncbi:MAG TPA: PilZ domain-containing protein [Terriglobales bacterium]|nr:PilZ domain-containing protein [Terriglobales bacterium]
MTNAIRALLVTPDNSLVGTFAELSREFGIDAQPSRSTNAITEELQQIKYEAVLLDFDRVPDAGQILAKLRENPSSKTAVVFALVSDATQRQAALASGANLLFERPVEESQIRRAIQAAYDLMARERRRYFRCAVRLPVLLLPENSPADARCTSINISSGGIALMNPLVLSPGDQAQVIFPLPGINSLLRAIGTVIWDDKHGKTGLSFKCTGPEHQNDLDAWLDSQLRNTTPTTKPGNCATS